MSGLLTKLNKRPRRGTSTRIVMPEHSDAPSGSGGTSFNIPRIGTSDSIPRQEIVSGDQLPWWASSPPQVSPQLHAVIVPAWKVVQEKLESHAGTEEELRKLIQRVVVEHAQSDGSTQQIPPVEIKTAVREIWNLCTGKGPLEVLFEDPFVTDIFVTNHNTIACRRSGVLLDTPFSFHCIEAYEQFFQAALAKESLACDEEHPIQNGVVRDLANSRISVIHRSLLSSGEHSVMIRVPRLSQISFYELIRSKTLPATVAAWLTELVATGLGSILIIGPSGSGKTTFASALLSATPSESRIITIEDTPELAPTGRRMEKFLVKSDEKAHRNTSRLLEAALHRAPDWIAFGELPPGESGLLLRAFESGSALLVTMSAPRVESALQVLVDDLMRERSIASIEECAKRFYNGFNLVITMNAHQGHPYLQSVSERSSTKDSAGYVDIIRFRGAEDGKRIWELCHPDSEWIKMLEKRGHSLRIGGALLAATREDDL